MFYSLVCDFEWQCAMDAQIAKANKIIIPAMAAVKFPQVEVNSSIGKCFKLPITTYGTDAESMEGDVPKATLMCLSFRAASQVLILFLISST